MAPAFSILFFTTASGAGYGLLTLLGLAAPLGFLPADRWFGFAALAWAIVLISTGLLSSTFHLGHPERAWRALSQWRSSWLSQEGVMALVTFLPAGLLAVGWLLLGRSDGLWGIFGLLAAIAAVITVACTGMIYASLAPIRQWHNGFVVPVYLGFALATGALWLQAISFLFGLPLVWPGLVALAALLAAWGIKALAWRHNDGSTSASSPESATGLGAFGKVRPLDPPHSEENYLTREMGYRVGRRHARKLRLAALLVGGAAPFALTLLALFTGGALAAACAGALGSFIERWLFFAEATHTVTLYYGARSA